MPTVSRKAQIRRGVGGSHRFCSQAASIGYGVGGQKLVIVQAYRSPKMAPTAALQPALADAPPGELLEFFGNLNRTKREKRGLLAGALGAPSDEPPSVALEMRAERGLDHKGDRGMGRVGNVSSSKV